MTRTDPAMARRTLRRARGFTLIDTILAMTIVAVMAVSLQQAVQASLRKSDAVEQLQLALLAQQFIDEISLRSYAVTANPPAAPGASACSRRTFNDVRDYAGYASTGICTVDGVSMQSLSRYSVSVGVTAGAFAGAPDALRIAVHLAGPNHSLDVATWRVAP